MNLRAPRLIALRAALLACALALPLAGGATGAAVVVGASLPLTGYLADLGASQRSGLLLWQEQINAAGGLLGRRVELKVHDDNSDSLRSGEIYARLIREEGAELLIGPLGSAATSMAAAVADRARRVLVNASGVSPALHKRVYRYVFQVPPPSDTTAAGVMPLAAKFGLKSLMIVASDESTAAPLFDQLQGAAAGAGVALRPTAYPPQDTEGNLAPFAAQLRDIGVDAVVTPANARESAELLRGLKAAGFAPKLFVARGAIEPAYIERVGMDAEYSVGYSSYEPRAATAGNAAFVKAYRAKFGVAPDFHAACGWASGKVLEAAVVRAGSFEQEAVRTALLNLQIETPLGAYRVGPDGEQVGAQPFLVQILKGRREVIWPEAYRSAAPVLPMPEWSRRGAK